MEEQWRETGGEKHGRQGDRPAGEGNVRPFSSEGRWRVQNLGGGGALRTVELVGEARDTEARF